MVRRQMRILERARYPHRRSKYANHIYTDHQHVVMLALRQHLRKSYRDFCDLMEACTVILDELGLKKVPHWTTLQKFSDRADMRRLERLLLACLDEARLRVLHLAVDSTGFSPTSASTYYVRAFEVRKDRPGRPRRGFLMRRYVKQTMAAEMKRQLIVAVSFCMGPANDSPEFTKVLEKVRLARQKVKIVMADKGYDAEKNHQYVREVLGARTMIPLRAAGRPGVKVWGRYRRKQKREFDEREYHQRAKIETIHSVEKRRMGDHLLAKGVSQQRKELVLRAFAYNIGRLETLCLLLLRVSTQPPDRILYVRPGRRIPWSLAASVSLPR